MNIFIEKFAIIYDQKEITDLNTKLLVPKMVLRRRLTRASKIVIYLDSIIKSTNEPIVYGSSFGELGLSDKILADILQNQPISPTAFQNSVYNTAVSYLSILNKNQNEIQTISSGDNTARALLSLAKLKLYSKKQISVFATETLNVPNTDNFVKDVSYTEVGVAMKISLTNQKPTIDINNIPHITKMPNSISLLVDIVSRCKHDSKNIISWQI
jgi:hypothetical protein